MKKNKVTLLDLGGVVFQSTGTSNNTIDWGVISKLNHKYGYNLNIGQNAFPEFMKEYNELTKQSLTGKAFLKEVFDTLEINTELIEIIRQQSEIIIVSDNYRENISYISKRYDFKKWAIKEIYSFDYEMVKSNPAFFKRLITDLKDYKIEDMIFIDDSIEKIESAHKSGIRGILYQNNQQIKQVLNEPKL